MTLIYLLQFLFSYWLHGMPFHLLLFNLFVSLNLKCVSYRAYVLFQLLSCVGLFCDPMDNSLASSSVSGILQAFKRIGVGCHFLSQDIFLSQGSNSSLSHWHADSLPLNYLGSLIYSIQLDSALFIFSAFSQRATFN